MQDESYILPDDPTAAAMPPAAPLSTVPADVGQPTVIPERVVSARDLWTADRNTLSPAQLSEIWLREDEQLVIPFSTDLTEVQLHYANIPGIRYCRCTGSACLLCRLGRSPETRHLVPVYDPMASAVAVLAVPASVRPGALRPQLLPHLVQVADGARLALGIRKHGVGRAATYQITVIPLPVGADDGRVAIAAFKSAHDSGRVAITDIYPVVTAAMLRAIPELVTQAQLRGVDL